MEENMNVLTWRQRSTSSALGTSDMELRIEIYQYSCSPPDDASTLHTMGAKEKRQGSLRISKPIAYIGILKF